MCEKEDEFMACMAKLSNLRAQWRQLNRREEDKLAATASQIIKEQISSLNNIHKALVTFTENAQAINDVLEASDGNSICMKYEAVKPFIHTVKNVQKIYNEAAKETSIQHFDEIELRNKDFVIAQKRKINNLILSDLSQDEFNRNFKKAVRFFTRKDSYNEESTDSSICTIISGDVATSSPI